ncbi:hypothetical protein MHU86_18995 [Fragilaria crotonensis]|nr:hypothetical protein MHU86_18995 [Fragilaria crotonensis]
MHPSPHLMRTNLSSRNYIEKCTDAEMNNAPSDSFAKLSLVEYEGNDPTESTCFSRNETSTRTSLDVLLLAGCSTLPSGDDQLIIRRAFLRVIETMLSQSGEHEGYKIIQLAQSLEQLLFKTAPSFREYANTKTLKDRIRLLTVSLLRRRLKKRQVPSREEALKGALGAERFRQAGELTHEVKQLR